MHRMSVWVAVLTATGCVSSATWSALEDVEEELRRDGPRRDANDGGARARRSVGRGCLALVEEIVAEYPGLRAPRERARAALAMARSEGALPAPQLRAGVWDFPIGDPQAADREGMYMLGLSLELPPGDALDGHARARVEEARAALGELAELRREVRARAAHTCADWSQAVAERDRLAAAVALLDQMRAVMAARLSATHDTLADLARLDGETARVERERAHQDALVERASARLNGLLGREERAALPGAPGLTSPPAVVDADSLVARALEARGEIASARARVRAASARASAAQASATVPTLMVGATYMQMPSMRPGLGAEIGMTLPWLWSGEGAARDAARIEVDAELDALRGLERDLRVEVVGAVRMFAVVVRTLEVLRARERPAAERALESIAATYAAGRSDFVAWIDAARALRELEVEEVRLLGEAAHALAELEAAVGGPVELEEAVR